MTKIHPSAIIDKEAYISEGCEIGAYSIIGAGVKLEKNVIVMANSYIEGDTLIGENTKIFPYTVIGVASQDLKYNNEPTKVIIGKNTTIREHVTIHRATNIEDCTTKIGDNCLLMVASHVAHDVKIGNNVIIDNNVLLAGHVVLGDNVIIGGGSALHQFCRIGSYAFIGGMSGVVSDIIPYAIYVGVRNAGEIGGVNLVGLRRKGFSKDQIHQISNAYDILFSKENTFKENIKLLQEKYTNNDVINKIIEFVSSSKSRSFCTNYRKK